MKILTRLIFSSFVFAGWVHAKDLRVLEITSDSPKLQASVEFLADKSSDLAIKRQVTANKSFDWFDVPEEATAARIKVDELATKAFDLAASGTTLVILGQPMITQDEKNAPLAALDCTVKTDRALAPDNSAGWVFFGNLKAAEGETKSAWTSLYLVFPSKAGLNADNTTQADNLEFVKSPADGKRLRVDFPLILRSADASGAITRAGTDKTIRAGQYVLVKKIRDPDEKGDVYAEVEVLPASGSN